MSGRRATRYALLAAAAGACATYHAKPLDRVSVDRALRSPDLAQVRVDARALQHPIIPPVALDERDGLGADEAAVLAVLVNPSLRAARDQRGLAAAQVIQAGVLPNPQLSLDAAAPTGGNTTGAINSFGVGATWEISSLVTRGARVTAARRHREAVELDIAWQEWQVAQAAKLALYERVAIAAESKLAVEVEGRLDDNLHTVQQGADRGLVSELAVAAAAAAATQAHGRVLELAKEAEAQRLTLNRLLGLASDVQVAPDASIALPTRIDLLPADQLFDGLEDRRLDLIALRRNYESQDAEVRAAILGQFPRIGIGITHARDNTDLVTTGVGISIDLPIFDRNQGRIAQAYAERQSLFDEYVDRVFEARAEVAALTAESRALGDQIASGLAAEPELQRLVDAYRVATSAGQADVLSYYTAWNNLAQQQITVLALQARLAEVRIGLELATGRFRVEASSPAAGATP